MTALFVFDRDDWCSVFPTVADAENDLEVADVEVGEYVVFDQDGTVFEARVDEMRVRLRATGERDAAQLAARLDRFTREQGIEPAGDDVIDVGNAILAAAWEERWPKRPRWLARRIHGDERPHLG